MAKIRVFEINKNGKIELSKSELETILNEVYNEGKTDGKSELWTWTPPYYNYSDSTISTNKITEKSPLKITYDSASNSASSKITPESYIADNESVIGITTTKNPTIKTVFCDNPASISNILGQFLSNGKEDQE